MSDNKSFDQKPHGMQGDYGQHLLPSVRPFLDVPRPERLKRIAEDVLIAYPELDRLLNEIRWLVEEPRNIRERGIFIGGENGSGKTAIARIISKEYPITRRFSAKADSHRALVIGMSGVRSTKAFLGRVLNAANIPIGGGKTIRDYEDAVVDALQKMHCSLLITDETQDMLKGKTNEQTRVIESMKKLMNEVPLPILALGTPDGKDAFRSDPHMAARFETYMIPHWKVGNRFGRFLERLEQSLPLKRPSNLSRLEIQTVLIERTGGCLDLILRRLRLAAKYAILDGTECITEEMLRKDLFQPPIEVLRRAA